jgi:hypothetical protein
VARGWRQHAAWQVDRNADARMIAFFCSLLVARGTIGVSIEIIFFMGVEVVFDSLQLRIVTGVVGPRALDGE